MSLREWRFRYLKKPPSLTVQVDEEGKMVMPKLTIDQSEYVEITVISDNYDRAHALADDIFYRRGTYGTKTGN